MTITGLDRLNTKLKDLPPEMLGEIRKAMEQGATEMVSMARKLVPVETGALKASIDWTWGQAPSRSIGFGSSEGKLEHALTIYAGDTKAYYARWVEFGTVKVGAQPYFFPSWRTVRKKVIARNKRAMSKVAKKVAAGGR